MPPARSHADTVPFFTLPRSLLESLDREVPGCLEPSIKDREFELSEQCGDHRTSIGFWFGSPLIYRELEQQLPPPSIRVKDFEDLGWKMTQEQLDQWMKIAADHSLAFSTIGRAYAGWLVTARHHAGRINFRQSQTEATRP